MSKFHEAQFQLPAHVEGIELNKEVAAHLANGVYAAQGEAFRKDLENYFLPDGSITVDPTASGATTGALRAEHPSDGFSMRLSVPLPLGEDGQGHYNQRFGLQLQRSLDQTYRQNRTGQYGNAFMLGIPTAITAGLTEVAVQTSPNTGHGSQAVVIAAAGFVGLVTAGIFVPAIAKDMARMHVTQPNTRANRRRLSRAYEFAGNLALPPLITVSSDAKILTSISVEK